MIVIIIMIFILPYLTIIPSRGTVAHGHPSPPCRWDPSAPALSRYSPAPKNWASQCHLKETWDMSWEKSWDITRNMCVIYIQYIYSYTYTYLYIYNYVYIYT